MVMRMSKIDKYNELMKIKNELEDLKWSTEIVNDRRGLYLKVVLSNDNGEFDTMLSYGKINIINALESRSLDLSHNIKKAVISFLLKEIKNAVFEAENEAEEILKIVKTFREENEVVEG